MMPPVGTQIAASDTADGIAIAFTTTGDVADLRTRVRRMSEMHTQMSEAHHGGMMGSGGEMESGEMHGGREMHGGMGSGEMHGGMMGSGGMHGGMPMVPSRAAVEDIPGGARLALVPTDPTQVGALRDHVRSHVSMMQKGECPMMQGRPPADQHQQHHPGGA